jgi:predicted metalloprotease with PDZ domain
MMALDVELRRRTRGSRGLDDVMVEALRRHAVGSDDPGVDHRRLRQALTSTEGGRRLGGMLDELMTTRKAPPLDAILSGLGFELVAKDGGEDHDGWLGLGLQRRQGKVVVTTHLEGSPLRNHVDAGDEVVAINDRRITEVKHVKQALSECAGREVQVLTAREGGLRTCNVEALPAVDHRKMKIDGKGNVLWRRITASRQQDA